MPRLDPADRLPFHCQPAELFAASVVAELVVLVIHLHGLQGLDWQQLKLSWFSQVSLFAQWIVLLSGLLICWLRPWLLKLPANLPSILAFQIAPLVTALSSMGLYLLDDLLLLGIKQKLPQPTRMVVVNTSTVLLVSAAFFRYLYLRADWQARIQAEAQARFKALQARIRPHFLFNSINTVASLIPVDAGKAEETLLDLAELFRSALREDRSIHTLEQEWALICHYLRIEKLRLGNRLQMELELEEQAKNFSLPALLLQPLVENALYHGIETRPQGGCIRIRATCGQNSLKITVQNPLGEHSTSGMGMAQDNIRQRLKLYYQGQAHMETDIQEGCYRVDITLPRMEDDEQQGLDR